MTVVCDGAALAHHRFEQWTQQTPAAIAVEGLEGAVTYAELDARAKAVAFELSSAGVLPGSMIGIAIRRSVEMLAAVLGVLKAGCAYVPMDLSHPQERLRVLVEDTAPQVIIVNSADVSCLPTSSAGLLFVENIPLAAPQGYTASADAASSPETIAYVTFTSGSTGRPKGIAMPHRAICNLLDWQVRRYAPWQPGFRTLQFASLSFDVSFQEIFSTLGTGGTLVLISEVERRDVHGLLALLKKRQIHRLFIPAVALQQMAEGYGQDEDLPRTLRTVIAGSEQLVVTDDLRRLFSQLPETSLHNEYGPSETHVTTEYCLSPDVDKWPTWVPIGRAISETAVYLVDEEGRQVPQGDVGEVLIGGRGLALGYVCQPALTAAAFVPDAYGGQKGARLYRTGDLARVLEGGDLEFIGRADSQVKIRGYRVELGEVQASLAAHGEIRSAFVRADHHASAGRRLIAYLVPRAGVRPTAREMRDFLRLRLPDYMIPSGFVFLDRFPLNVNGKINQELLPPPEITGSARHDPSSHPHTALEHVLIQEFSELTGASEVGREDSFFDLGGYSMLATKLLWRLQTKYSVELNLADFIEEPTVASLARIMQTAPPSQSEGDALGQ
jgi:amino acid adenylation domain-containing protein